MTIKISELPNINSANLIIATETGVPVVSDHTGSLVTYQSTMGNIKNYIQNGNLNVSGSITAGGISTFNANVIIAGNLNVQGTTTTTSSQNLSTNASIIDLHTFTANLDPWNTDDGRDIGLRFFYYKTAANASALVWENSTTYLTWYGSGVGNSNVGAITGTLGTMQLGQMLISNATPATANATGALQVSGGISTGGNIFVVGNVTAGGSIENTNYISSTGALIAASLQINGAATLGSSVVVSGAGTVNSFTINNGATIGSTLVAGANATINALTVNSSSVIGSTLQVVGTITTGNILPLSNAVSNIGSTTRQFNTVHAVATEALYADLAERYLADADYEPGTVVIFGGEQEITTTTAYCDHRVAGAISTEPAYLMNSASSGLPVALRGKIPVKVVGSVKKGDLLVTSTIPGYAEALNSSIHELKGYTVFAKSLEADASTDPRIIWAVII